jgi:hypothetical protein
MASQRFTSRVFLSLIVRSDSDLDIIRLNLEHIVRSGHRMAELSIVLSYFRKPIPEEGNVKQLNVSFQIGDNLSVDVISCSKFDKN